MAKKGTPGLRQALKAINTLGRQMNREAMGDYGIALSASKAGQAGLRAQLGRLEGDALRTVLGSQRALGGLTKAAKRQQRGVRAGQARTVSRYGAALGGSIANSYGQARASAAAGTKVQKGYAAAGRAQGRTAQTVMGIAEAGASAQGQAAKYALAQALQARNTVDAQTLAQMTSDIYQSQLQFEQQKAMLDYQFELEQKKLEEQEKAGYEGLQVVANTATEHADSLRTLFNSEDISELTPAKIAEQYITDNGISDPNEQQLIMSITAQMYKAGAGPDIEGSIDWAGEQGQNIVNSAITNVFKRQYPQFNPVLPDVSSFMETRSAITTMENTSGSGGLQQYSQYPSVARAESLGYVKQGAAGWFAPNGQRFVEGPNGYLVPA
jgi:hypothetical protein